MNQWKWYAWEATFQFSFTRTPGKTMKESPFHGILIFSLMGQRQIVPRWQWLTTLWRMEYWCFSWWSQRQFQPKWGCLTTFKWKVKVSTIFFPFKSIMENLALRLWPHNQPWYMEPQWFLRELSSSPSLL
jgi:hypothetical protein